LGRPPGCRQLPKSEVNIVTVGQGSRRNVVEHPPRAAPADWIILLSDYDSDVVERVIADQLSVSSLRAAGARDNSTTGRYGLAFTMTPLDVAAT
jgi:hypothetical protein